MTAHARLKPLHFCASEMLCQCQPSFGIPRGFGNGKAVTARVGFPNPRRTCRINGYIELIEHSTSLSLLIQAIEPGPIPNHEHIATAKVIGNFIVIPMLN